MRCDVAIVGGGPGGTTLASLLKKYSPSLDVCIFEKESFPRDHVGESQLPPTSAVLHEMGAWEKVEAAGFPIKLGASYTWGKTMEPKVGESKSRFKSIGHDTTPFCLTMQKV
jgi:2-polyprenyl-6-methoxyphenol hydroxylase-like FAD-dependent oxidoreductase